MQCSLTGRSTEIAATGERQYSLGEELDRAQECRAVVGEVEDEIAGRAQADWDAEIAAAEAADRADDQADHAANSAAGHLKILSTELDGLCRSVRTIGKTRFKTADALLARDFQRVPTAAYSVKDVIDRAQALDVVWGDVPTPETWELVPGVTRAVLQAKLAAVQAAGTDAREKERLAESAHSDARALTAHLHTLAVGYRTEGLAAYPRGSRNWTHFNSLPTTTARRRRQRDGEGEAGGEPEAPTS